MENFGIGFIFILVLRISFDKDCSELLMYIIKSIGVHGPYLSSLTESNKMKNVYEGLGMFGFFFLLNDLKKLFIKSLKIKTIFKLLIVENY